MVRGRGRIPRGPLNQPMMVAFGFLHHNFGRYKGPLNGTFSFYECKLIGEDTQMLPAVIEFI